MSEPKDPDKEPGISITDDEAETQPKRDVPIIDPDDIPDEGEGAGS